MLVALGRGVVPRARDQADHLQHLGADRIAHGPEVGGIEAAMCMGVVPGKQELATDRAWPVPVAAVASSRSSEATAGSFGPLTMGAVSTLASSRAMLPAEICLGVAQPTPAIYARQTHLSGIHEILELMYLVRGHCQ